MARSKISNGDFTVADEELKLGTTGLWVERDLYRAIPVTQDLGYAYSLEGAPLFSRFLRQVRDIKDLF